MNFNDYQLVLVGIGEEFENNERELEALNALAKALEGKDYFVVTLCMDDVIFNSNLDMDRVVAPLGGKRFKQCPDACDHLYYSLDEEKCSVCGKSLIYNNYEAENYVEESYLNMWEKHKVWLTKTLNKSLLVLELGVSLKLPQIIRFPYERISFFNQKSHFVRVNETLPQLSAEIADKGESIKQNSVEWLVENII